MMGLPLQEKRGKEEISYYGDKFEYVCNLMEKKHLYTQSENAFEMS